MNKNEFMRSLLGVHEKKPMPVLSFPSVALLGINVNDLISDSHLQATGMKLIADRVQALAAVSMMDLSVEAEAFGAAVTFSDMEVPTVTGILVPDEESARALEIPAVGTGRTGRYIEAIREACTLISDRPVLAGVIGPYSLAGRLMGVSEILMNCLDEPEAVEVLMEKCTEFLISYIKAYKEVGADGVVIAEPLTGLLSPAMAEEFSEPYTKRIIDAVKDDNFLVVYHNCGNTAVRIMDSIVRVGADCYHFGNAVSMKDVMEAIPSNIIAMGNVDPASQFRSGTPESIRKSTLQLLEECSKYPNFVLSSGCDIPASAPWENIDAFFACSEEFYRNI